MTSDDQTQKLPTPDETPEKKSGWSRKRIGLVALATVGGLAIIAAIVIASVYTFSRPAGGPVANALKPAASQLPHPSDSGTAGATPGATPSAGATDTPASPAPAKPGEIDARFGGVVAQTAEVKQDVKTPSGLTASVVSVESYTATAKRAGEVSGPAVKVTLRLTNGTGGAFPVSTAGVNAYYGSGTTPASPVANDPAAKPFTGSLAPGASTTAVYVFTVPADQDAKVTVTLSDQAGAKLVVFQ
ncbi:hypothetical protein AB4Z18_01740 [Leifsonia sp. 2TAF2]|uniref:hypothetical protein n=1 Tax=Leifsonia sp. 2TAF2 TaxID=3233009 RepID=UPI003F9D3A4D